jgi:hypothetical protein
MSVVNVTLDEVDVSAEAVAKVLGENLRVPRSEFGAASHWCRSAASTPCCSASMVPACCPRRRSGWASGTRHGLYPALAGLDDADVLIHTSEFCQGSPRPARRVRLQAALSAAHPRTRRVGRVGRLGARLPAQRRVCVRHFQFE